MDIPYYAKLLKVGGLLLISGFYQNDLPELQEIAGNCGLQLVGTNTKNEWAMAQFLSN